MKDARQVTSSAATYLANCTARYSFEEIRNSEIRSYRNAAIEAPIYRFFEKIRENRHLEMRARFERASESMRKEGIAVPHRQRAWNFEEILGSS
jgi:hypothetical protein